MVINIDKQSRTIDELNKSLDNKVLSDAPYLQEWRNVRTLLNDYYFDIMLNTKQMSQENFARCLNPNHELTDNHLNAWFLSFKKILNEYNYNHIDYSNPTMVIAFPFINYVNNKLENVTTNLLNIKVKAEVIDKMKESLVMELFNISGKIIALELSIFKDKNNIGSNKFLKFVQETFHSENSYYNFFNKYPTLARIMTTRTEYLTNFFITLIKRVDKDHQILKNFLNINNKVIFNDITLGTGDSHSKGKSVSTLDLNNKKIVYKPKNLEVTKDIKKFIDWTTSTFNLLDIKLPESIYHDDYSYVEYIDYIPCKNNKEVENYYKRYGVLVSLSYILGITDLHVENIIANGEYPVIIDIETAFQNVINIENENLHSKIYNRIETQSIKSSLLLPKKVYMGKEKEDQNVELSALNGKEHKIKEKNIIPVNVNSDNFHYKKIGDLYAPGGNNIPFFKNGEKIDFRFYINFLIEGFKETLQGLFENKPKCIKFLRKFENKKIRILTKGTERYASMIRYSNHPNYNREMKYRERLFMNIWAYPYKDKRLILSEFEDLLFNDVPIFESFIDSKCLIDSRGKRYENYFNKSGLEIAIEKLNKLNNIVIEEQELLLLTSLGISNTYLNRKKENLHIEPYYLGNDYFNQSKEIINKLMKNAIIEKKEISFITLDCDENLHWDILPTNESIYNGVSGMAILYLELYKHTQNKDYFTIYKKLIYSAIQQAKLKPIFNAFQGYLSPLYPLILEKKYFNSCENEEFIRETINKLNNLQNSDIKKLDNIDYISGISGFLKLIYSLLSTFEYKINNTIIENLESKIQIFIDNTLKNKNNVKIGIAHGLSGVALCMAYSNNFNKNELLKLLELENTKKLETEDVYKWCKGLAGMVQVRLHLKKLGLINDQYLETIINKFENILYKIPNDDCLCHGSSGILITLKMLYEETGHDKWLNKLKVIWNNVNYNKYFEGYKIPKLKHIESVGLFDGISGIAWTYLYLENTTNNLLLMES